MEEEVQREILRMTGFKKGKLPVNYLGVPLDSRNLPVAAYICCSLYPTDKIMSRVTHWSSKLLSYAGRLQLIKSVITSITVYWLQIYPIPKKVLKHIADICRLFLWSNSAVINKKAHVASEKVCDPKTRVVCMLWI